MKAGDDRQGFVSFDDEQKRIRKAAKQSAAHFLANDLVNYGKLPGVGTYAAEHRGSRLTEATS